MSATCGRLRPCAVRGVWAEWVAARIHLCTWAYYRPVTPTDSKPSFTSSLQVIQIQLWLITSDYFSLCRLPSVAAMFTVIPLSFMGLEQILGAVFFFNGLMSCWPLHGRWKLETHSFTLICNFLLPHEPQLCTHFTRSHFDSVSCECLCLTVWLRGCLYKKVSWEHHSLYQSLIRGLIRWLNDLRLNVFGNV